MPEWLYEGDDDIKRGGFYWKQVVDRPPILSVVRVQSSIDWGGNPNVFHIHQGDIELSIAEERRKEILECIGVDILECTVYELIKASVRYLFDIVDYLKEPDKYKVKETLVYIGDDYDMMQALHKPSIDVLLPADTDLRKYVTENLLP
jgi:hypothetical protein